MSLRCFIHSGTCNNHIGMGVRYNAEKKKIGNYFSTPIYSFRCKCHLCDGWFEIHTDPKVSIPISCDPQSFTLHRIPDMLWCLVQGKKTKSGTLRKTADLRFMVGYSVSELSLTLKPIQIQTKRRGSPMIHWSLWKRQQTPNGIWRRFKSQGLNLSKAFLNILMLIRIPFR